MSSGGGLHVEWSRTLFAALADSGVREVVLSPGSRSTPLAIAAAEEDRIRVTTVVDERAAAFVALGQARVTGKPSVLVCTSGTAAAHYHPAIAEADAARVPILILTALTVVLRDLQNELAQHRVGEFFITLRRDHERARAADHVIEVVFVEIGFERQDRQAVDHDACTHRVVARLPDVAAAVVGS